MSNNIEKVTPLAWLNNNFLACEIWSKKYKDCIEDLDQWLNRVSGKNEAVKELIYQKKFIFGGRILASRGLSACYPARKASFSNCYVIPPVEDNIEGIYKACAQLARTYSYGGGCGIDISNLRPAGADVSNAARTTSGAVSFMSTFDEVTKTIGQHGRRGALMLSLDVRHPDVQEFVNIKTDLNKVTSANISIRVSDEFMSAVKNDEDFILTWPCDNTKLKNIAIGEIAMGSNLFEYGQLRKCIRFDENGEEITGYVKRIRAKELFDTLCRNNWNYAEPGILYWDTITNDNLLSEDKEFQYAGVNPCAEEPLPAGGSCLLGSLNLSAFVENKVFQEEEFKRAVRIAVTALNDVLLEGLPLHPLEIQQQTVNDYRQIGLGIMGLADALIKMEVKYGSPESLEISKHISSILAKESLLTSNALAKNDKYGKYPKFTANVYNSPFFERHITATDNFDFEAGLANSQILTIAPTGSISTMWNISGGIEPIFAKSYTRTVKSLDNVDTVHTVYPKIIEDYMTQHGLTDIKDLPEWFVSSEDIKPQDRIKMQAVWQQGIDASISSTVNLPETATVDDVKTIYMEAWNQGLKGVTVFRANCARTAILVDTTKEPKKTKEEIKPEFNWITPVSRRTIGTTYGATHCKKCACGTLYITTNLDKDGNLVEVFTHTSKGGICQANLNAVTRMISMSLRAGVKIDEIEDQLKSIHCPACQMAKAKGHEIDGMSCPDIMSRTIKEFKDSHWAVCKQNKAEENKTVKNGGNKCPECGEIIVNTGGCISCPSCGWSKCN